MDDKNECKTVLNAVEFSDDSGRLRTVDLSASVCLSVYVNPYALCRACVYRMKLRTLERMILAIIVDDAENSARRSYSYAELGEIVGKCTHSVENAVTALRAAGLLSTARVHRSGSDLSFSCDAFVRWATLCTQNASLVYTKADSVYAKSQSVDADAETVDKVDVPPVAKKERRRARTKRVAQAPAAVATSVAPVVDSTPDEEVVDATEERNSTIAVSGQSSDDDEISFGSETADTDMGHGVVMNPDL